MVHDDTQTTTERRRARKRAKILSTAQEIVREGGLEALTVHALARRLEITPGALYRYFDSHDDLVVAIQLEVLDAWGAAFVAVRARCASAPVADAAARALLPVLAVGHLFRALATEQPARFALVSYILGVQRQILGDAAASPLIPPLLGLLGQVASDLAAAEGVALSPGASDRRALMLLASLQGLLQLRKLERLAPDALVPGPVAPELVRTLLLGWGAQTQALARGEEALAAMLVDAPLLSIGEPS